MRPLDLVVRADADRCRGTAAGLRALGHGCREIAARLDSGGPLDPEAFSGRAAEAYVRRSRHLAEECDLVGHRAARLATAFTTYAAAVDEVVDLLRRAREEAEPLLETTPTQILSPDRPLVVGVPAEADSSPRWRAWWRAADLCERARALEHRATAALRAVLDDATWAGPPVRRDLLLEDEFGAGAHPHGANQPLTR